MQVQLTPVDDAIHSHEVRDWLVAFHTNASLALAQIPNHVYAFLREQGLIDHDLTLSPQGLNLMVAS